MYRWDLHAELTEKRLLMLGRILSGQILGYPDVDRSPGFEVHSRYCCLPAAFRCLSVILSAPMMPLERCGMVVRSCSRTKTIINRLAMQGHWTTVHSSLSKMGNKKLKSEEQYLPNKSHEER